MWVCRDCKFPKAGCCRRFGFASAVVVGGRKGNFGAAKLDTGLCPSDRQQAQVAQAFLLLGELDCFWEVLVATGKLLLPSPAY